MWVRGFAPKKQRVRAPKAPASDEHEGPRVRVLVADDHPIYREGIVRAVNERLDLELVGEAADGREALAEIKRVDPDVAVLDIRMPKLDGTQVLGAIRRDGLNASVLFLSAFLEPDLAYRTVAAGASGYLSKEASRQEICDAIAAVARGGTAFASEVQEGLQSAVPDRGRTDGVPALTRARASGPPARGRGADRAPDR